MRMIEIDGSQGEGGGQILRTSLALSLVTGKAFRIVNIRAGRPKPGLLRQHLTSVHAAAEVGGAKVEGDTAGSRELTFTPGAVRAGRFHFRVGTAGSTTLVAQAVLPALLTAAGPSELVLEGGTHNPFAPPFDFVVRAFLPPVARMGPSVKAVLDRPGFYPAGGGKVRILIEPAAKLSAISLLERGEVRRCSVRAVVANLPLHIAEREARAVQKRLSIPDDCATVEAVESAGPGNVVTVEVESEHVTEVFTGFGQKGVRAEAVARGVADEAWRYLDSGVPVGQHLADQLLIPMALAGEGAFRTLPLSSHAETNIEVMRQFLSVSISVAQVGPDAWEVVTRQR